MDERNKNEITGKSSVPVAKAKWYRIYVNSFADEYELWSVDEGTLDTEIRCFKIIFAAGYQPGTTNVDLTADSAKEPRAWISVYGVLRELMDNKNRKVILITRK